MKNLKNLTQLFLFVLMSMSFLQTASAQLDYSTAIGLRAGYYGNFGLTGKKAIGDAGNTAVEGIVYADFNTGSNYIEVNGLYEKYYGIGAVENLNWYWGAGAFVGFFTFDNSIGGENFTYIGAVGGVGLEYQFANTPIALSIDWLPRFSFTNNGGFYGRGGSFAARYIID